jgi:hypothetical protein
MPTYSLPEVRRLSLLGKVILLVDGGEPQVTPDVLMQNPDDDTERAAISADMRALRDHGFVALDERLAGMWVARPTANGRDAWAQFSSMRGSRLERQRQLRNEYMLWIYEAATTARYPQPGDFLQSGAGFLGEPYTAHELERVAVWLKERGFIRGQGAWGHPAPISPEMTAKGEDYIENERDVHVDPRDASGPTHIYNGPTQVAHAGRDVTQTQHNQVIADEALRLVDALRQLAKLELDARRDELTKVADELEAEAAGEAEPGRLRSLAESAQRALSSGAGGALGSFVSDQLGTFLTSLAL